MNDERLGKEIGDFYRETDVVPPDSTTSAREVAARLSQVEQAKRRRWRPTWLTRATHESGPIPASYGRSPTVIGRTSTMLSPAKAIIAGALVFALGGTFVIAQPFQQGGGTAPGAEADVEATWVTGTVRFAPSCVDPERVTEAGLTVERGYVCEPQTWESDDPRLGGTATAVWNADVYWFASERYSVINALYDIEDATGGWTCRNSNGLDQGSGLFTTPVGGTEQLTCTGYGDHAGLTSILAVDWQARSFEGLIFDRDVPPLPELPRE